MKKSKKLEDGSIVLLEYPISDRAVVRVVARSYKKLKLIDVRQFYADLDGALKPGKGISLSYGLAQKVRRALRQALLVVERGDV
jgi:hypothetical protein